MKNITKGNINDKYRHNLYFMWIHAILSQWLELQIGCDITYTFSILYHILSGIFTSIFLPQEYWLFCCLPHRTWYLPLPEVIWTGTDNRDASTRSSSGCSRSPSCWWRPGRRPTRPGKKKSMRDGFNRDLNNLPELWKAGSYSPTKLLSSTSREQQL